MAGATHVLLAHCKIVAVANKCLLVQYKSDNYWIGKEYILRPEDYKLGDGPVSVWVTQEYALEENLIEGVTNG